MKKAKVYMHDIWAGVLTEDDEGFTFLYRDEYHQFKQPISLTLPVVQDAYRSQTLFPFFDGLIPEGWLLEIAQRNWKLDPRDRMSILLAACKDCIGAVSVHPYESDDNE